MAPPPLILCEADAHLGRPTLEALLSSAGYDGTGGLLPPPGGTHRTPAQLLDGVEVLGLYFSASWCAPCVETTPLLASAYASLRSRDPSWGVRDVAELDGYGAPALARVALDEMPANNFFAVWERTA